MHSGCTVVTAFLRLEDEEGHQSFLPPNFDMTANLEESSSIISPDDAMDTTDGTESQEGSPTKGARIRNALKNLGPSNSGNDAVIYSSRGNEKSFLPSPSTHVRRVLYCANAGDARAVLCRNGRGVRLTYDHKGSDKQEAKRIMDAGGFVMSGRVNGVLAVTRALGDSSMKEFVVGAPYTTETELRDDDEFLILACDGVCLFLLFRTLSGTDDCLSFGTLWMTKRRSNSCVEY